MSRTRVTPPVLLSDQGSTRATAYPFANKSVRIDDRTHAVWLDGVSSVTSATFDHRSGKWTSPVHIDDGRDNHACPTLTAAPDGRLRLAYGPRSCSDPFSSDPVTSWELGKFRVLESVKPNDAAAWRRLSHVGYAATYGCLVTDKLGRDHLVYHGGSAPPAARYERRQPDDAWDRDFKLMHQNVGHNYTHSGASLVARADGTLFVGFHFYALPRDTSLGVCVLMSPDGGETWQDVDGRYVRLPIEFTPALAVPQPGTMPYLGSLSLDTDGNPIALTHDMGEPCGGCFVSVRRAGAWRSTRIDTLLPGGRRVQGGNVTVAADGRWLAVLDTVRGDLATVRERWAHASGEVFLLASDDGGRAFECVPVSGPGAAAGNWLPTISLVGPNHDTRTPLILYTQGVSGAGRDCRDPERSRVFACFVE